MPSDEMVEKARNRIWFDTEFIEDGRTVDLLAIGLVREDGATYYAEPEETDRSRACEWVRANVLPHLTGPTKTRAVIAADIVEFVGASPEFWAYYADYDWVALCQLYGRMIDLPKGWPMFCRDLKQVAGDRKLIPQTTTEHNALTDAIWTKEAHAALSAADVYKAMSASPPIRDEAEIRRDEREKCAKVLDDAGANTPSDTRAGSLVRATYSAGATAIRARGET